MGIITAIVAAIVLAQFIDGRVAFVLVGLVFVARHVYLHKQRVAEFEQRGITGKDIETVSQYLDSGDGLSAFKHIEGVEKRHRTDLIEKGVDTEETIPEVGREIPWTEIVRQVFRVLDFDRSETTLDDEFKVIAKDSHSPLGYLLVESPILNQPMRLPITHSDDFRLAASIFDHPMFPEMSEQHELLVTYVPKLKLPGSLAGIWHAIHYVVTPRGTLEQYYSFNNDEYMRNPSPEKIFKPFVWNGEVRVEMNFDPKLD